MSVSALPTKLTGEQLEAFIAKCVQARKDAGLWTECDELGHDLISVQDLTCRRCGDDFNEVAEALEADDWFGDG